MKFWSGYKMKLLISGGVDKNLVWGSLLQGMFLVGREWAIFWLVKVGLSSLPPLPPTLPSRENRGLIENLSISLINMDATTKK